jgi:hypothetical protein
MIAATSARDTWVASDNADFRFHYRSWAEIEAAQTK